MSTERRGRVLPFLALVLGVLLTIVGLFGVGLYVAGVIDILIDQPADRSWLFWGLGIAFTGFAAIVGGIILLVVWRKTRAPRVKH